MTNKEIGEKIRLMRRTRGMTQKDLAAITGLSESAIAMYEAGKRKPKDLAAEALADVFNVPKWSLFYNEDEMVPAAADKRLEFVRQKVMAPFNSPEWKHLSNGISGLPEEKRHLPNYELAAKKATEILIRYRVRFAPISPLPILKAMPGVIVISYAELASLARYERDSLIEMIDAGSTDALTLVQEHNGKLRYIVAYNMRAPYYILQYALACQLGHIALLHDGSKDDDVREAEVECFANYLLFPRPLLKAGTDAGIPPTEGNIGRAMGCFQPCLETIKNTPGIRISGDLNIILKEQFSDYVNNYIEMQETFALIDNSPIADLGTYLDNYEE